MSESPACLPGQVAGLPLRGAALPGGLQGQPAAGLPRLQHQAGGLAGLAEEGPAGQGLTGPGSRSRPCRRSRVQVGEVGPVAGVGQTPVVGPLSSVLCLQINTDQGNHLRVETRVVLRSLYLSREIFSKLIDIDKYEQQKIETLD